MLAISDKRFRLESYSVCSLTCSKNVMRALLLHDFLHLDPRIVSMPPYCVYRVHT
jgi:hypothetical protein